MLGAKLRKSVSLTLSIILMATAVEFFVPSKSLASSSIDVSVNYHQTEARGMLDSINSWRNAGTTYTAPDGTSVSTGALDNLTYDYNLEQIAMQRAAELVVYYSHIRPDGSTDKKYGTTTSYGENIAYGFEDASSVFAAWKEDSDDYANQGHRRNMLGIIILSDETEYEHHFTSIGIACVEYDGVKYWVQEFGYTNSNASATTAVDSAKTMSVSYDSTSVSSAYELTIDANILIVTGDVNSYIDLPSVSVQKKLGSYILEDLTSSCTITWSASISSVVSFDGDTIKFTKDNSDVNTITASTTVGGSTISSSFLIYSVIGNGGSNAEDNDAYEGTSANWYKDTNGKWHYRNEAGADVIGWISVDGDKYYTDAAGIMVTGWQKIDGVWYYFDNSGVMQTGWVKSGSTWYYMNENGVMLTGWQKIEGTWYYLGTSGAMATGWVKDGNNWYYLRSSGAMATGWVKSGDSWYYMRSSGAMATGWIKDGGSWYYMSASGAMTTGWQFIGGSWYYMYDSGSMAANTWVGDYYVDGSGACQ